MNKAKKLILIISVISIILILTNFVFYPAHISTTIACSPQIFEERYSDDYHIVGQATINQTTEEISIELISMDKKILKHELIHVNQFKNRGLATCSYFGLGVFIRESEAYLGQYYPDTIYRIFYGDIPTKCLN